MKKPFFLLIPFFLLMALVLASIWNVLTQSLGYIPAFGLREPTFGYYARVLKDPGFLSSVLVSLKISVWSAVISTVLGVLLSMALIQCGKQRGGHVFAVRIPVLVPHAVAAVFMIQIFSQTGSWPAWPSSWALLKNQRLFRSFYLRRPMEGPSWPISGRRPPLWRTSYWPSWAASAALWGGGGKSGGVPGKELLPDHPSLKRSGDLPGLSHYFYLRLRRL